MEEAVLIVFKMQEQFKISAAAHKNVLIQSFVLPWNFSFKTLFNFVFYFHTKAKFIVFFIISVSLYISGNIILHSNSIHVPA